MGNPHVPMTPERNWALLQTTFGRKLTIKAGTNALSRPEHNPIPVCSHDNSQPHDQLWTSAAFVVDGLGVRLRGFRKSHHFIPADLGGAQGIAAGSSAQLLRRP